MLSSTGTFETANASKYLQQLCKHFAHKIDVEYDATSAKLALPVGPATLEANESGLTATVSADSDETLARAKMVIDKHLETFAFRENFSSMKWS